MKPITREWISKAEGDWSAAGILFRSRKHPNYDGACFHTQQCAEKYLKARLEEAGIRFGKTHDLEKLLSLALTVEPSWNVIRQDMIFLTAPLSIAIREAQQPGDRQRKQSSGAEWRAASFEEHSD